MIGRGATDAEIRSACAPYCTGGFDETDLDDFLDRGRAKWNIPDGASVERLARLTRVEYEQQRKAAAKELGMRVSVLDRMVERARGARPGRRTSTTRSRRSTPSMPWCSPATRRR